MPRDMTSFIDERAVGRYQWLTILLCGLVMFVDGFDTQMISYMAPHIAAEWGLSRAQLGPIFSAALAGLMVGYLLSPLSDRFGHKRMVVLSTLGFAVTTFVSVSTGNAAQLIVLRFLTGLGLGLATPSAIALTGEYSPRRLRATFVLAIYCGFSLGFVVAGLVSSWLIPAYGWRAMFWAGGLSPLLLVPALIGFLPEALSVMLRPGFDRKKAMATLRRIAPDVDDAVLLGEASVASAGKRPALAHLFDHRTAFGTLLLWLVFFINLGEFYALQAWLPTILTELGRAPQTIVAATSLVTVGGIVVAFIVGPAMDRVGPYKTLAVLYSVGFLFVALMDVSLGAPAWMLLATTFLAGFCVSGGQKSAIALAAVFYSRELRSTGVGWALGVGRGGGIVGPLLVGGALARGVTPTLVFLFLSVPMLVMAVAIFIMGRRYGSAATPVRVELASDGAVSTKPAQ